MADGHDNDLTRRDLIKLGAATTVAASLGMGQSLAAQQPVSAAGANSAGRAFFTPEEFALVDELSELIIPTDEHSPGARAAKVAAYIDSRLADAWEQERIAWREGLRPFLQASADERLAILTRIAQNESQPRKPEELFFAQLKSRVVHAYYTSEIGIKQEMEYTGNSYLAEFVGVDVS